MYHSHLVADNIGSGLTWSSRMGALGSYAGPKINALCANGNIYLLILAGMVFCFVVIKLKGNRSPEKTT